jgi:2-polyprenyl-6-methoxyphenol hydroxylase-like FAD-dependent oxidoreductase
MSDLQVLVVGGGPTGLVVACQLAMRGVGVRVVDKSDRFYGGSRADGVQPRTMEVFDDLGVVDRMLASGDLGILMKAYKDDEVVWEGRMTDPVEPTPTTPYPNPWFVPQFRIEEILRERLAELGVRVELSTALTDFTQDDDGVTATLDDGETLRVRYLVGADGGASTVRKKLGIAFPGETDENTTTMFADAWVDGVGHDHGRIWPVNEYGGVSVMPLAGTEQFVVVARPQEDKTEPVRDYLQRQVTEASGRDDIIVREVTWHTTWRANTRLAERFRDGRVFLVGDAGHVHPPTGGQGMNTGIGDAYNLGWKLAAALTGAPEVLLDSYEPERMAAARLALELSTALLAKHKRGDEDAHVRGPELYGLTLNYRGGLLGRDDRPSPGRLTAGDRAPDAPVSTADGTSARLFDLYRGPHWTLLSFGMTPDRDFGPDVHVYTVVEPGAPAGEQAVVDRDGHVREAYDMADGTLVLVRPDGYVGLVTGDVEQVSEYWAVLHGAPTATR